MDFIAQFIIHDVLQTKVKPRISLIVAGVILCRSRPARYPYHSRSTDGFNVLYTQLALKETRYRARLKTGSFAVC